MDSTSCRHSLAILTDPYQLTMAYGYRKPGKADREAVSHLTFRRSPFLEVARILGARGAAPAGEAR